MADKDKLPPEQDIKLENLNLAIEREEIYKRMDLLNKECNKFKTNFLKIQSSFDQLSEELQQERHDGMFYRAQAEKERIDMEYQITKLKEDKFSTQEQTDSDRAIERRNFEQRIKELQDQCTALEEQKAQMDDFVRNKAKNEALIQQLRQDLETEKKTRINDVNEKEREKLQEKEKLRRQMLGEIKKTKASLLALNDDQQHTTTRLTILQNTQLTHELEYQSKQTEKLLLENQQKQHKIDDLNRELIIQKDVEKELARRSHFCQKVIKQLKVENKELSDKFNGKTAEQTTQLNQRPHPSGYSATLKYHSGSASKIIRGPNQRNLQMIDELKSSEDLINFLEQKLEQHEKTLMSKKHEYEALQKEYHQLQEKFSQSRNKYKRAALILTDFLEDIVSKQPNILQGDKELHLNMERIKDTPFEGLTQEDRVTLALVLLKQLQPYLSAQNLQVAPQLTQLFENKGLSGTQDKLGISELLKSVNVQSRRSQNLPPLSSR